MNSFPGQSWQKKGPLKSCTSTKYEPHLYFNQLINSSSDEEQPSNKARRVARACLQVRPSFYIEY